jgi:hypothetical protein
MDGEVIKTKLSRVPFIPFRIEKTGGTWFDITNSELVNVTRRTVEIGMRVEQNRQRFVTIDLIHASSVEILMPTFD